MIFFHISDLHIGLKLFGRDLREDQEYIFDQIVAQVEKEQPDAILIAGDIYDKALPSAEAVETFDHFVSRLSEAAGSAEIMMISGNHDSAPRVNVFRSILSRQHIHMIGKPPTLPGERIEKVRLEDEYGAVHFYLLPFVKPSMVRAVIGPDENGNTFSYDETLRRLIGRETIDPAERNVLLSHQFYLPKGTKAEDVERMDSEIRTIGNIDEVSSEALAPFDYAALGHIHKPMRVGEDRFRYPGTPYACSVSEAGQQKGILKVCLGKKGELDVSVIPLHPKRQVRLIRGSLKEVLDQACEDYVSVVLTDRVDLDISDMNDRLRAAFPYLLEIRRETVRQVDYTRRLTLDQEMNPFELCCSFLQDIDDSEKELLSDVVNTALAQAQ
ncbi:MAG: exonuclease SbcCD subunit D [Lachnospiraceae bacterium]|nr:exonuclease SbcCD subunit D [Lachnospiraceae bacterium]